MHDYSCLWDNTFEVKGKPIMVMDALSWVSSPISLEDMELQSKGNEEVRAADTLGRLGFNELMEANEEKNLFKRRVKGNGTARNVSKVAGYTTGMEHCIIL
ncbi:hypothetical protein KI387_026884, partial [Taxus chinensis]